MAQIDFKFGKLGGSQLVAEDGASLFDVNLLEPTREERVENIKGTARGTVAGVETSLLQIPKAVLTGIQAISTGAWRGVIPEQFQMDLRPEIEVDRILAKHIFQPVTEISQKAIDVLDEKQRKLVQSIADEKPGLSSIEEYAFTIAAGGTSFLEGLGALAITKSPNAAAGFLSIVESSDTYLRALQAGKTPEEALNIAGKGAVATYGLELVGLETFIKSGVLPSRLARATLVGAVETTQELLQTFAQNLNEKLGFNKSQRVLEGWYETIVGTAPVSIAAGLFIPGGVVSVPRTLIRELQQAGGLTPEQAKRVAGEMTEVAAGVTRQVVQEARAASEQQRITIRGLETEEVQIVQPEVAREIATIVVPQEAPSVAEITNNLRRELNARGFATTRQTASLIRGLETDIQNIVGNQQSIEDKITSLTSLVENALTGRALRITTPIHEIRGRKEQEAPRFTQEQIEEAARGLEALAIKTDQEAAVRIQFDERDRLNAIARDIKAGKSLIRGDVDFLRRQLVPETTMQIAESLVKQKRPPTPRELKVALPLAPKVTRREDVLLREKLKAEEKGARVGAREARKVERARALELLRETRQDVADVRKRLVQFAKENLPVAERGKMLSALQKAETQRDLAYAFSRVLRLSDQFQKKEMKEELINRFNRAIDSPSVSIEYKQRLKEIIPFIGSKKKLQELRSVRQFLLEQAAEGKDVELPRRILLNLESATKRSLDEMTLEQLENILEDVILLDRLGRTKLEAKRALLEAEKEAIAEELIQGSTPMEQNEIIIPKPGEQLDVNQKLKNFINEKINLMRHIDRVILPMDVIFDMFDGSRGTYDGPNSRLIKRRIDKDFNNYLDLKDSLQDPIVELANELKLGETNFRKMGVVAAREQDGGMEKLINTGFTEEEINAVQLTSDEQRVLDLMRSVMDSQFPQIQQVMKDVYNEEVKKVKNYFSFMTDWDAMDEAEVFRRIGTNVEEFGRPTKNVEHGFTKTRTSPGRQKIQINAMKVFQRHTDNVAYLLALGRDTKMLFEIINSDAYRNAVGEVGQLLALEWIDLVARKGGSAGANQIAMIDILRKNFSAGVLGFKLSSALIQPTALIDGMGMIGPGWVSRGVREVTTNKEWREFVTQFPELRDRAGGEVAIRELIDGNWLQALQRKGFIPLQELDRITATMVAAGAYMKKAAEMGIEVDLTSAPNPEAMDYAQLVLRRTQASALFKDVPLAISRGALTGNRSLDRAIFQFQTFLLTRWSRIRHDAIRVGIETEDPAHAANVVFWIMLANLAAAGIRIGTRRLVDFITGDEEEEDALQEAMTSIAYEMAGTMPFMGNLMGSYVYNNQLLPLLQPPATALRGAKSALTGKSARVKVKGVSDFITSLLAIGGIPGAIQTQQVVRGLTKEEKSSRVGGVDFGFGRGGIEGVRGLDFGF